MKCRKDLWGAMAKAFEPCSLEGNRVRLARSQGGQGRWRKEVVGRRPLDWGKATGEGLGGEGPQAWRVANGVHYPMG